MKLRSMTCALALSMAASTALAAAQPGAQQGQGQQGDGQQTFRAPAGASPAMAAPAPAGKRINRAIEMLLKGQPVYYQQVSGGGYDDGRRHAATKADYILYDMEHGLFDLKELREYMRGLVDAGLTRTGHRSPTVIATLPLQGTDYTSVRTNIWMIQQALATGIHGILLVQAESPEGVKAFVEASRYPFAPEVKGLIKGNRGSGSQQYASQIWGITQNEYLRRADVWPANPDGELMLGIKIENPRAVTRAEELTLVPGMAFAEWGPGDQGFYLVGRPGGPGVPNNTTAQPSMVAARARVLAATKAAGIKFLNACSEATVVEQIREGTMICTGGDSPAADVGRAFTKRTDPF